MKNPIQPVYLDIYQIARFKSNKLVEALIEHGQQTGFGLNDLAQRYNSPEHLDDFQQLAQLIGYSLDGYSELSYCNSEVLKSAILAINENAGAYTSLPQSTWR